LIDPGAEQADLFGVQRFRRREIAGATRRSSCRIVRATGRRGTTRAWAAFTGTTFWRHGRFIINAGRGDHDKASLAVAGFEDLAVVAAFQEAVTAIETKAPLRAVLAMTTHTGFFEERLDVFRKSNVRFGGGRRELRCIDFAQVRVVFRGESRTGESKNAAADGDDR
jgi:hypothetical protein